MPYWRLFYHFTWGTIGRQGLIARQFEASLHNVLAAKVGDLGGFVYAVGGTEDHVHVVASVPPGISLADFVGQLKGCSSHWVNHQADSYCDFRWQAEYGVVSFGGKQLDTVVRYVKNQRKHHEQGPTLSFLEMVEPEDDMTARNNAGAKAPV